MIRITQIKLELNSDINKDMEILKRKAVKLLKINADEITGIEIAKRSIDARKKPDIKRVYTINVFVKNENKINKKIFGKNITIVKKEEYKLPKKGIEKMKSRPVIVGLGPAGLFCGYLLAREGYRPVILERGENVDDRTKTVEAFWNGGELNEKSNVQFGEGGAGTFSDGKLNTLVKDKNGRNKETLRILVKFGAKKEILYDNKPHIGTDVLKTVVKNMREEIVRLGGEVRFLTQMTDISMENDRLSGITVTDGEDNEHFLATELLVLAPGHSARDTFEMLNEKKIHMEAKAFAVGVRVEHSQKMINKWAYGVEAHNILEAADYKVTYNSKERRGVYSFCMCPGGYVVNASSEKGRIAVNGMSYSGRDGKNSNSAIIVTVDSKDYGNKTPLDGMYFQRRLEENAYREGNGHIPVQLFGDFEDNIKTEKLGDIEPSIKGRYTFANVRNIFPEYINQSIIEGIHSFSGQIEGYDTKSAVLSGVESRTSSPVRIVRNDNFESNIKGIYPCGEGAGYAGGITSAAMDGIRVAEAIISKYKPF